MPDTFDERDFMYRPRLQPLPTALDQRQDRTILTQSGFSCTGHAVAAMINTVLAHIDRTHASDGSTLTPDWKPQRQVSPYMLYYFARRYDEFGGAEDTGSSLRGVLKGWHRHGVALHPHWPNPEPDAAIRLDAADSDFARHCRQQPLGAYYRVNPYRLDDMQSAICELNAIAASALVHKGWEAPVPEMYHGEKMLVLRKPAGATSLLSGHAFALVGYNAVGFLVQNSWGLGWGCGGFATLPYQDWVDHAYDAWVARPGVPETPIIFEERAKRVKVTAPAPPKQGLDVKRLRPYVVNLENDGRLSRGVDAGQFTSSPEQIDEVFNRMEAQHTEWKSHQIVFYAHGGLVGETAGLQAAERHLPWWLANHIYPVYFVWQSGFNETPWYTLEDWFRRIVPFGAVDFNQAEAMDRRVEQLVRSRFRWPWEQMKDNARGASSKPLAEMSSVSWPPSLTDRLQMQVMPGASLVVHRLQQYQRQHPETRIHLVCHSAGSIFLTAMLARLKEANLPVESFALMAPGITVQEFDEQARPLLTGPSPLIKSCTIFALEEDLELNDECRLPGLNFTAYNKSLVYLVARGFERSPVGAAPDFEVPILGLQKYGQPYVQALAAEGLQSVKFVISPVRLTGPKGARLRARSRARGHGDFEDDADTMTAVAEDALGPTGLASLKRFGTVERES
jgi:hypothetical protein